MRKNKIYLGLSKYNEEIYAEIDENSKVTSLNGYYVVHDDDISNGCGGMECISSTSEETLENGEVINRGDNLKEWDLPDDDPYKDLYEINTCSCEECGQYHDIDDFHDYAVFIDGWLCCNECIPKENMLKRIEEPSDIFKVPNMSQVDLSVLDDEFTEIDELFCDSSGFGNENEPALTQKGAEIYIEKLLNEHGEIYGAITSAGQFQVYVTIFKKETE